MESSDDAWLSRDPLPADPLPWLDRWLREAFDAGAQANPHAMTLATVDARGRPAARTVLCKRIDLGTAALEFYTNRDSRKGEELASRPRAALVFYWGPQSRQARVEGAVEVLPDADSDAYWRTRPLETRLGAWASDQSRTVASREALVARWREAATRFGLDPDDLAAASADAEIPRPAHWGGYRVAADRVELWRSRPARLHDRALWQRALDGSWRSQRLQP